MFKYLKSVLCLLLATAALALAPAAAEAWSSSNSTCVEIDDGIACDLTTGTPGTTPQSYTYTLNSPPRFGGM